jgi:hypothetical protein
VTKLTDLPPFRAKRLAELECLGLETRPWVTGPALSIPPAVALGVLVRGGAPTDRAGNRVGGRAFIRRLRAFVFVFACPSDDPLLHSSVVHGRLLDRDDRGTAVLLRLPRW